MISINGSLSVAAQLFNLGIKKQPISAVSTLLKIAGVKSGEIDFVRSSFPLGKVNTSFNVPSSHQSDLVKNIQQTIKEFQLHNKSALDQSNITAASPDTLAESKKFRLAKAVDKLYPRTQKSLDNIDRLVVFGDSLSDSNGRMFEKTHHIFPSYNQYYEGRFTNGFVWGEYLASPAFLKKEMVNFAEGGSTSTTYSHFNLRSNFLSNLDTQMKGYQPSSRDLTIIFSGANDYITLHKHDILKVVENQIDKIENLLSNGAKNLLVMGLPDISLTPESEHSDNKREYKDISISHNNLLQKNIDELKEKYPDAKIFFFDTSSALKEIITVARQVGYDTTHSYTTHGYVHIPTETDPALNIAPEYLYNDGVHPTQEVHHTFATILNDFIVNNYSEKPAVT